MTTNRVFLTGATGYIGRNLAKALTDRDVHVLVRPDSRVDLLQSCENITFHIYDGSTDSVLKALEKSNPAVVFHLAAQFIAEHKASDIERLITGNVLFGTQLLEAMSAAGVRHLVNTGTSWQHFEGDECRPVCLYAATKQAFETFIDYYVDANRLSVVTLQLFDSYGPGDSRQKLFNILRTADRSKPLLMSGGEQLIDLVYVDDVIAAFIAAAKRLLSSHDPAHERFGVSSGNPKPLREIVELYLRLAQSDLNIEWGARPYRKREVMKTWTGHTPVPAWKPAVDCEEGFRRMLADESGGAAAVHR